MCLALTCSALRTLAARGVLEVSGDVAELLRMVNAMDVEASIALKPMKLPVVGTPELPETLQGAYSIVTCWLPGSVDCRTCIPHAKKFISNFSEGTHTIWWQWSCSQIALSVL